MPKIATKADVTLSGATMGTIWQVVVDEPLSDAARMALQAACQAAVDEVDDLMSTWRPDSALMRFNAAPVGEWHDLPGPLLAVLEAGLAMGVATEGAFEMNVGEAVRAWGFGPEPMDLDAIRKASGQPPVSARDALAVDRLLGRARKAAPMMLDLCGIAKGYGVDRLVETALAHGIARALCSIDGEVRALGCRANGQAWAVGIDAPDDVARGGHSVILLADAAVATSGDYRHFLTIRGTRLSHTIQPEKAAPVVQTPASVTVLAQSCMLADAMATALMVMGRDRGVDHAREAGISALFLDRDGRAVGTGLFDSAAETGHSPDAKARVPA